ncbi:YceI family protein [Enterovirga rhinocerotis]|nr:YceI family protein [Enterovirga rhinocerotis]
MKAILLAATLGLAGPAFAQSPSDVPAGTYRLDPSHASLTWRVKHLGLSNYTARFSKLDATLTYDPKDPTKSKLTASVDPASVKTDLTTPKDFDQELRDDPRFFKVAKFPEIKFVSTKLEKTGDKTGRMAGDLTFMGVTKPVTLDVTFNGSFKEHPMTKKAALGFSATGVVKRSEFGLDAMIPFIGDDVSIAIEAEFQQP